MKTPQGVFPEEDETMPAESIRLQRNKTTIFQKPALSSGTGGGWPDDGPSSHRSFFAVVQR
ncbi:hypothetical protein CR205_18955 [Alteribacter lacisalsi]|uniref:Uncharacterized protein n=1 Tax=Alteribacter lacisalsi TaxID=2045244 RepID=A0A2W0H4Q3_9BACI|nr:hypothetical protein CR205_18955 [Alteribacter lacisalsi]